MADNIRLSDRYCRADTNHEFQTPLKKPVAWHPFYLKKLMMDAEGDSIPRWNKSFLP
jgi:hypothetical protein